MSDGKPKYFDVDLYLDAAIEMVKADEIERALWMLDNMPGYYRDNPVERAGKIRETIFRQLMTAEDYINDMDELKENSRKYFNDIPVEEHFQLTHYQPRGKIMYEFMVEQNKLGKTPHIFEFAPANFWLPRGLAWAGLKFWYCGKTIHHKALAEAKAELSEQWKSRPIGSPVVFCCFETLEHLWNEEDLLHYFAKFQIEPDYVFLSTPKYTLEGGMPNWDTRVLGHIRTYTPGEFISLATKFFPGFEWDFYDAAMMTLKGVRRAFKR